MSEKSEKLPPHEYQRFLQSLPADWERKKIRQLGTVVSGGTPSRDVPSFWRGAIPWVTPGELSGNTAKFLQDSSEHISATGLAGSGANLLPVGSLMVTTRATLGARAINAVPMATNQGFKSIIFKDRADAGFYFHLFEKVQPELMRRASGTTFLEISAAEFSCIEVPSPSSREKCLITKILDTLDTVIHETEAIIAKLKAVKQGLLHDLLTRGIDANGELRPPQSEAPHLYKQSPLGWIPKEWGVVTLRDAALPSRESFIDGDWIETPFITSEGIRLIQTGNIGIGEFLDKRDSRRFISEASFRILNCKWVNAGDILICRLADPIGRACIVPEHVGPAITSVDCTIFRVDTQNFSRDFVIAWMNADASLKRAQDNAAGSTRSRISRSNLGMLPIAKPSLHEQQLIARTLSSSAERIASEDENLSKLREIKAGLMDDLLTGRVRVTPLLGEAEREKECA